MTEPYRAQRGYDGDVAYEESPSKSIMSNELYDDIRWLAQYFVPALATFYFALSTLWGWPYGEQIIGSLSAFNVFLGAILGVSRSKYYKTGGDTDGILRVDTSDPEKDVYKLELLRDIADLPNKKTVTFAVDNSRI